MSNNDTIWESLNCLSKYFETSGALLSQPNIKNAINENTKGKLTHKKYSAIIEAIIKEINLPNSDLLLDLFSSPSVLSISSYRKFLQYKALASWEQHRSLNANLYNNLFERLHDYLINNGLIKTLESFNTELTEIEKITGKDRAQLTEMLFNYYVSYHSKDQLGLSTASSNIKSLIKAFNGKAKNKHMNKFIEQNISEIKPFFKIKVNLDYGETKKMNISQFLNIVLRDNEIRSILKIYVLEKFKFTIDNDELTYLITNIINQQDQKNLEFLHLEPKPQIIFLENTKAYNRLNKNYLQQIRNNFNLDQIDAINKYLLTDSQEEKLSLRTLFTSSQLKLLEEIRPIIKKANSELIIQDNVFVLKSNSLVLDPKTETETKKMQQKLNCYQNFKNLVSELYYSQSKALNKLIMENKDRINLNNIPFTDDNYSLNDTNYLLHFSTLINILLNIDPDKWKHYSIDSSDYKKLKKLLIKEGLLACVLIQDNHIDLIINIINNLPEIIKNNSDISINNITDIAKKTSLFNLIDQDTIELLGEDVAKKIAYDTQFLQGKNTPDEIKKRLKKAKYLISKANELNTSAIPYFDKITVGDISLERYLNNDPEILTSGIDSSTCFKISANDNDYLFYSILNKNGMIAKITKDNKLIGRITAHRLSNVLLINGIRTAENSYQASSLNQLNQNNNIIETIKVFANTMIQLTENSDCPIDFVVSNKAGLLESPVYNFTFPLLPEYLFENPIDCYNEDFEEFRNICHDGEELLQEVPYYESGRQAPFTTDFGHYPVVLIASREGKYLERKFDITLNSPEAIYERPNENHHSLVYKKIKSTSKK